MARTDKKVRYTPLGKVPYTPTSAAEGVEQTLKILEGRWKLVILFHLFGAGSCASRNWSAPFLRSRRRC
jgi:DNA-binding HxlR family transcriptional regulator